MFFTGKKNKSKTETTDAASKSHSVAGFLFNPSLGDDIRPIGENINIFVRFIALVFASNGLFPKNHPALLGVPGHRLSMGMIISTAYRGVSFTREGMPKAMLFLAVVGCLVFSFLTVVTAILVLFTGTAHAADPTTGLFGLGADAEKEELAMQWLNYLYDQTKLDDTVKAANPSLSSGIIQAALIKALAIYSNAVLVLGGIILLYHLLAMVAETAHTGKPMGRANQIWAPIRLVVAIGLLVPMSASNLNVGQYATVQVARWGSALASNVWTGFITAFNDEMKLTLPKAPPTPLIDKVAEDLVLMAACARGYNHFYEWTPWNTYSVTFSILTLLPGIGDIIKDLVNDLINPRYVTIRPEIDLVVKPTIGGFVPYPPYTGLVGVSVTPTLGQLVSFSNISGPVCGHYAFPEPKGSASVFYTDLRSRNKETVLDLATGLLPVLASSSSTCGKDSSIVKDCNGIPNKIVAIIDSQKYDEGDLPTPTDLNSIKAVLGYMIEKNTLEAMDANKDAIREKMLADLLDLTKTGWVSAGAWLNTIARIQGDAIDSVYDSIPTSTTPLDRDTATGLLSQFSFFNSHKTIVLGALKDYRGMIKAEGSGEGFTDEQAAKVAAANIETKEVYGFGTGIAFILFSAIDRLGSSFGAWPSSKDCAAQQQVDARYCVLWKLESSNPLSELAWIGHNNLKLGLGLVIHGAMLSFAGEASKVLGNAGSLATAGISEAIGGLLGGALSMLGGVLLVFGTVFTITGVMLAYVLPLIPFVRFFFNIMNWLIVLFEAVVSMPLFALAHLDPTGEGLPGNMARQGYFFLLAIMLRPVLMVFGLIAGLLLFNVAIAFLNKMFIVATAGTGEAAVGGGFATMAKFIYSIMYLVMAYICANTCFKAIGHFPDHALQWMNSRGPGTKDLGDQGTFDKIMGGTAAFVGAKLAEPLTHGAKDMGRAGGEGLAKKKAGDTSVEPGDNGGGGAGGGPA